METLIFIICIATIAFLYASVGHGGASGYLALMAIWGIDAGLMKPSALILNILVSGIAFVQFYREGYFKFKLLWPFIITSVPMAFIGAQITLPGNIYKIILGSLLAIAVLRMVFQPSEKPVREIQLIWAIFIGGMIGLVSGMIGIGGGIILSPVLILTGWATIKQSAAVSAIFILLNSISGFSSLMVKGVEWHHEMGWWITAGFIGGLIGSYFGSKKFKSVVIRNILAGTLLMACLKLILI